MTAAAAPPRAAGGEPDDGDLRVRIETSEGVFTLELYPARAPEAVSRFLARSGLTPAPAGLGPLASYPGTEVCESRAGAWLVFGCVAATDEWPAPRASGLEPPQADEIDGRALGLAERVIAGAREVQHLWQREVFPRYVSLREARRPVPAGLEALVSAVRRQGESATTLLEGASRLEYYEALGYRYTEGASELPVVRGAVATASLWPGEADERFLVALEPLPVRDGRATVFGRVVDGWPALEAIVRRSDDKFRRPDPPVILLGVTLIDESEETNP